MRPACAFLVGLFFFAAGATARGGPAGDAVTTAPTVSPPPLPSFMAGKRKMHPHDAEEKQGGGYFTGLPLVDSDPDTGWGFGARVYGYWEGARADPLFAYTPYRHRVYAQVFATTNGYQQHILDYDAPYFAGSPFRLRATLMYQRNTAENYFGRSSATLGHLRFPGANGTFATFASYRAALRQLRPDDLTYSLYNKYDLQNPSLTSAVERDFFRGLVRVQVGFGAQYVGVHDYTGRVTGADDPATGRVDVPAAMATTKLREDCGAARIVGCSGGIHNTLKLGIAFDTLDFEPDPNEGVFVELTAELSSRYLGSDFDYARLAFAPRGFVSPFPKLTDLVVAGRLVYEVQTSGVPFFSMNDFTFTGGDHEGLGGLWTMRGYKQDRFVGPVAALANIELRWTFVDFSLLRQTFAVALVPFLDIGRVFDSVGSFTFAGWKRGEGAGLSVIWNKATVIAFDYGVSDEDSGLYVDFGYQF